MFGGLRLWGSRSYNASGSLAHTENHTCCADNQFSGAKREFSADCTAIKQPMRPPHSRLRPTNVWGRECTSRSRHFLPHSLDQLGQNLYYFIVV